MFRPTKSMREQISHPRIVAIDRCQNFKYLYVLCDTRAELPFIEWCEERLHTISIVDDDRLASLRQDSLIQGQTPRIGACSHDSVNQEKFAVKALDAFRKARNWCPEGPMQHGKSLPVAGTNVPGNLTLGSLPCINWHPHPSPSECRGAAWLG